MSLNPELHQRLLELIYDLLPEEEAAALRARIETDEELARAYAEAQENAVLFKQAAKVETSRIQLYRPSAPMAVPFVSAAPKAETPRAKIPARVNGSARSAWTRWANWTVGLAAGILLMISVGGYLYHRGQLADIAAEHLRLRVTGPAQLQAGIPNRYAINTTSVTGNPIQARIEFALYSPDGEQLLDYNEKTDERGQLAVTVPADLKLPDDVKLEVVGLQKASLERVEAKLAVEPVRSLTRLTLDRSQYHPGDTVRFRSLTLSRVGLAADRDVPIRFEVRDPSGALVPNSATQGKTEQGIGLGEVALPPTAPAGQYALIAQSLDGSFREQRRGFVVHADPPRHLKEELEFARERYTPGQKVVADVACLRPTGEPAAKAQLGIEAVVSGKPVYRAAAEASPEGAARIAFSLPEKIERPDAELRVAVDDAGTRDAFAKRIPLNLGKARVAFFPEGGNLVAGLENRVYFASREPSGKALALRGTVVDSQGKPAAVVETAREGMGSFSLEPIAGEHYRLKIDQPADAPEEPKLPEASSGPGIVLTTGLGVFDAGKPLEFNVRATEANLPLVAAATCRGVQVGQQTLVTREKSNAVAIPLDDAVAGVLRLTIYDYRNSPPKPIAERLVYRRPAHRLQVRVAEHPARYAPGESVDLGFLVTDEQGQPASAVLGASVVNGAILNRTTDRASMASQFLLAGDWEVPEDLERSDFYLSDDPKQGSKAAVALDLLLATRGGQKSSERSSGEPRTDGVRPEMVAGLGAGLGRSDPPAMFDNLPDLEARYKDSLASYRANRTRVLNTLTTLSFFGGAALVVLVAMLSLMNIPCGLRLWAPSLGVAVVCLVIGAVLMNPERLKSGPHGAVAFASFHRTPEEIARDSCASEAIAKDSEWGEAEAMAKPGLKSSSAPVLKDLSEKGDAGGAALRDQPLPGLAKEAAKMPLNAPARSPKSSPSDVAGKNLPSQQKAVQSEQEGVENLGAYGAMGGGMGGRFAKKSGEAETQVKMKQEAANKPAKGVAAGLAAPASAAAANQAAPAPPAAPAARPAAETPAQVAEPAVQAEGLQQGRASQSRAAVGQVQSQEQRLEQHYMFREEEQSKAGRRLVRQDDSTLGEAVEPLYWAPKLTADSQGRASAQFRLGRVDGTYQVRVDAYAPDGRLGSAASEVVAETPMRLEAKAAPDVRALDRLDVLVLKGNGADLKRLAAAGYPHSLAFGGRIEGREEITVQVPADALPGSVEATLHLFPTLLAGLQSTADEFLKEPSSLEQAAALTSLGAFMLQTLQEQDTPSPALMRQGRKLVSAGYAKLLRYESPAGGFDPFGRDPGQEGATAVALQALDEAAKVHDVDRTLLARTKQWLAARIDGKGERQQGPDADQAVASLLKNRQLRGTFPPGEKALAIGVLRSYGGLNGRSVPEGKLVIKRGDAVLAEQPFRAGRLGTITVTGLEQKLQPGENRLTLEITGGAKMPCEMSVRYHSLKPANDERCPLHLSIAPVQPKAKAGQTVVLNAGLTNTSGRSLAMPVAVIGLPAGLSVRPEQLEPLKKAGTIDAFEIRPDDVVFSWRTLAPKQKLSWKFEAAAATPGQHTGPASCAYLAGAAERKQWAEPVKVEIAP